MNRKIQQSNSSNNVALSQSHGPNQRLGDRFLTAANPKESYNLNYDKTNRVISDSNLVLSTKLSDKNANNSAILAGRETENNFSSNRMEGSLQNGNNPYNRRAMSDDYFPDDFNDRLLDENTNQGLMELGEGGMLDNDDDDDFRSGDNY